MAAVLAGGGAVGCGDGNHPYANPCKLLTSEQVNAATGWHVTQLGETTSDSGPPGARGCNWGASGNNLVSVWVLSNGAGTYRQLTRAQGQPIDIPGSEAQLVDRESSDGNYQGVFVLTKGRYLNVAIDGLARIAPGTAETLTREALAAGK